MFASATIILVLCFGAQSNLLPCLWSYNLRRMNSDIRERLRRLGVHRGTAHLKPSPAKQLEHLRAEHEVSEDIIMPDVPSTLQVLERVATPYGHTVLRREYYDLTHIHGDRALQQALAQPPQIMAQLASRNSSRHLGEQAEPFDLHDALFLDTETTGLAGGAGTLAFLIGIGYFEKTDAQASRFVVEQYFLRDPVEEAAMLHAIDRLAESHNHLVTFNGRSFDVPLIETRFIMSRLVPPFGDKLHLDLLMPARRAWRNMLGDCSLGSLEYHLLGVRRDQQDIAGFLIPELYREYLQSGNSAEERPLNGEMQRVMYHNLHDILSMVTLTSRLCEALSNPGHTSEHLALGRQHEHAGEWAEAADVYRNALRQMEEPQVQAPKPESSRALTPSGLQTQAMRRLANALKKQQRHADAVAHWVELADLGDVQAALELAKHYEWREVDVPLALGHARRALQLSQSSSNGLLATSALRTEIERRIVRLERKMGTTD